MYLLQHSCLISHCRVFEVISVVVSLDSVASYHYACCYCVPVGWFIPGRGYGDRSGPMRGDTRSRAAGPDEAGVQGQPQGEEHSTGATQSPTDH